MDISPFFEIRAYTELDPVDRPKRILSSVSSIPESQLR